jgi:hypothetical protein
MPKTFLFLLQRRGEVQTQELFGRGPQLIIMPKTFQVEIEIGNINNSVLFGAQNYRCIIDKLHT